MAKGGEEAYEGLANLAHAIRRSMAAYIAMNVTPPDGSIRQMLANADEIAAWIGGHAAVAAESERMAPPGPPLGKTWPPED